MATVLQPVASRPTEEMWQRSAQRARTRGVTGAVSLPSRGSKPPVSISSWPPLGGPARIVTGDAVSTTIEKGVPPPDGCASA